MNGTTDTQQYLEESYIVAMNNQSSYYGILLCYPKNLTCCKVRKCIYFLPVNIICTYLE